MSENRVPGKPDPQALDGVLNELRDVLANLPSAEPAASDPASESSAEFKLPLDEAGFLPKPPDVDSAPPPVLEATRPAPVFEIISPPSLAPDAVPPVPRGIETAPENWSLLSEDRGRDVPPPVLDGGSVPTAPTPSWLQPDAGIVPEPDPVVEEPTPVVAAPYVPAVPEAPPVSESFLPIPGTVEARESAAVEEPTELDLETTEERPEGLIQIACLFPEGEEKTGQSFVNRLRDAAGRMKKPLTIQPVFLHTWSTASVDVAAWAKSAALSGADVVFVIAPRASQNLFPGIAKESQQAGTAGRVIVMEHLQSPALYADVLVELNRRRRGPR